MKVLIQHRPKGSPVPYYRIDFQSKWVTESFNIETIEDLKDLRNAIDTYLANLPKPHVHAELMALYAKDAAETDKPWERWEKRLLGSYSADTWHDLSNNALWQPDWQYRRKEGV